VGLGEVALLPPAWSARRVPCRFRRVETGGVVRPVVGKVTGTSSVSRCARVRKRPESWRLESVRPGSLVLATMTR
jgi:hypothetical protein